MNAISLKARKSLDLSFSVDITSVSTFVAVIAAAVSIIATASGADITAAVSAAVALAAVYTLEKKGGDR